jgi:hypothetical protein
MSPETRAALLKELASAEEALLVPGNESLAKPFIRRAIQIVVKESEPNRS